jgi:nucleoside-diphosphate-sugar epimerase
MRVFVTGAEGYIGHVLCSVLGRAGHEVVGFDAGFYRDGWLYSRPRSAPETPRTRWDDLRQLAAADLAGYDAVVHLAELSNDPLGANRPEITYEINHRGSVALAQAAKAAGVPRFVYTSSCSVYGTGTGDFVDETSPVNPQTAYADCKVRVERDVGALSDAAFCPVFLRNATAYGPSPRMRFDIVLNDLCALAWTTRRIRMTSDGTPWRPLVHVEDICEAIRQALEAPADAVRGAVLNVGDTAQNFRVREIAEIVAEAFPGCELEFGPSGGDNRSYRVNFDRIRRVLPQFRCRWTARDGALQLREVFERIRMDADTHRFRAYTRLKQLQYLQGTGQLDPDLYWQP